jgi:hypothetical protein
MSFIIGLVLLVAFLPVTNDLVNQIQQANMDALSFSDSILLLAGLSGLLMVVFFFNSLFQEAQYGSLPPRV